MKRIRLDNRWAFIRRRIGGTHMEIEEAKLNWDQFGDRTIISEKLDQAADTIVKFIQEKGNIKMKCSYYFTKSKRCDEEAQYKISDLNFNPASEFYFCLEHYVTVQREAFKEHIYTHMSQKG